MMHAVHSASHPSLSARSINVSYRTSGLTNVVSVAKNLVYIQHDSADLMNHSRINVDIQKAVNN